MVNHTTVYECYKQGFKIKKIAEVLDVDEEEALRQFTEMFRSVHNLK